MKNPIVNFCLRVDADDAERYLKPGLKIVSVSADLSGQAAAALADVDSPDIVLVQESGATCGLLFPEHLRAQLPHTSLGENVVSTRMSLLEMVKEIDNSSIDFHSETVNYSVMLRRCPVGHLVNELTCSTHNLDTDEYP